MSVKAYLKSLINVIELNLTLGNFSNKQLKNQNLFFNWQLNNGEHIKINSFKSDLELKKIITEFLTIHEPKLKGCYETAFECTQFHDSIKYVEGLISFSGLVLGHAWNCYKGIYFDLISETLHENKLSNEYFKVIRLSTHEMYEFAIKTETKGEYLGKYMTEKLEIDSK